MDEPQEYTLPDADGSETTFVGHLLGSGSSERSGSVRWSEMHIYRTLGDNYVVHKIGRTTKLGERDRFTLHVSTEPQGAIESCKTSDGDGALFFTRVARDALSEATIADPALHVAFYDRRLA